MWGFLKKIVSLCNFKTIYLFDLVHDNVKTRVLIPIMILFLIFIFFSSIFSGENYPKSYPQFFNILINPPSFLELGQTSRTFVTKILDQNSIPLPDIAISIGIESVSMYYFESDINCDYLYLNSNYWNINFMRTLGPCSIELIGDKIKTDYTGIAYFDNFQFKSGPKGNYYIYFKLDKYNIVSSLFHILVSPEIYSMYVINEPPKTVKLGLPLNPQPILILYNKFDQPLENKIVYAISWPFPDFHQNIPPLFDPDPDKFAVLNGSKSNPSDKNSQVTFPGLSILGSTHPMIYLRFISEGISVSCPWKKLKYPAYSNYHSINIYIDPILIQNKENNTIDQISYKDINIEEGTEFENQPIFQVLGTNKNPLEGIMCFALIRKFNNMNFPSGFYPTEYNNYPKSIIKMASGIYEDSGNITLNSFHGLMSNKLGIIEFNGLSVSKGGTNYNKIAEIGIIFACGNAYSNLQIFYINTTVSTIEFKILPSFFIIEEGFIPKQIQFSSYAIRVLDKERNPISNKQVNELILKEKASESILVAKIKHRQFIQSYYYSKIDITMNSDIFGFIYSEIVVFNVTNLKGNFFFGVKVDGVEEFSNESIFLILTNENNKICNLLYPQSEKFEYNLTDEDKINFNLSVFDYQGNLYNNTKNTTFTLFEKSYINALFFNSIDISALGYKFNISNFSYVLEPNQNPLFIENFSLLNFFSGSYYSYFAIYTSYKLWNVWDEEVNLCINSKPIIFHYINSVSKVTIMNQINDSTIIFQNNSNLAFTFEICVQDISKNALRNFSIIAEPYIYDYSPVYSYDFFQNPLKLKKILSLNSNTSRTNEFGAVSINIIITPDYLGDIVFGIQINGISSIPIKVKFKFDISSINIIHSPSNRTSYLIMFSMNDSFQIQLNGSEKNLDHIPVLAFFHGYDLTTHLDVFPEVTSYINFNKNRINYSDENGIITFNNLTLLSYDNYSDRGCIKGYFYFKLATNLSFQSKNSYNYTFCPSDIKLYLEGKFSNPIFFYNTLKNGITVHYIENMNSSLMKSSTALLFKVKIIKYDNKDLDSTGSSRMSFYLFNYNNCNYREMIEESYFSTCNISENSENPISGYNHYYIKFTSLYFSAFVGYKMFDLTICLYHYCNYTSKSLSGVKLSFYNMDFDFISDFPSVISLEEEYVMVKMHPNDIEDTPSYVSIHCNIVSFESLSINNLTISNLIAHIGDNINEPDLFNSISQFKTRVNINNTFTTSVANLNGYVIMTFEFISGVSGYYCIECQSEYGYKFFSNAFYLENDIKYLNIINDQEYTFNMKFVEEIDGIEPVNITLNFTSEIKIISNKSFKDSILDDLEIQIYDMQSYMYFTNFLQNYIELNSELQLFWNVLIEGPLTLNPINNGYIDDIISVSKKRKNDTIYFTNFKVELPSPGIYRMKYFCKGVQSNFSMPIIISKINYETFFEFLIYYRIYIFIILILVLIIFNSIYLSNWSILASILFISIEITIYAWAEKSIFSIIFGGLLLALALIFLIVQFSYSVKYGKEASFKQIKERNSNIYARNIYMKLFHSKVIQNNSLDRRISNEKLIGKINIINQSSCKFILHPLNKSENEFTSISFSFHRNNLVGYFKELLNSIQLFNIEECFYFPQRFLLSIGIALFTLIYCAFQVTTYVFTFISTLSYLKNVVASRVFSFVNTIIQEMAIKLNYSLSNYEVSQYYLLISKLMSIFTDLENSVKISLIISNIIVFLIFCGSILILIIKFKAIIIKSRRSDKFIMKKGRNIGISSAGDFTGFIMGNTALSYLIITSIATLIIGFISNKYFWKLIWDYKIALLILLIPGVIQTIIEFFMKEIIYKNNLSIRLSCFLQIYDIYCLFSSIIQGIITSFTRIIYGFCSLFIGLIRFDKSIIPKWLSFSFMKDDVSESFYSLIFLHISYSNPIFCNYIYLFIENPKTGPKQILKKLWISYLHKKFPSIKQKRKNKFINHSNISTKINKE